MNEPKNKYRYVLTDRFGTIDVSPLGEGDFKIDYDIEEDGKYFYSKQFNGKIIFTGETYNRMKTIEQSIYICTAQRLQVFRKCENSVEVVIFDGYFKLTDGNWDYDNCQVELKFGKNTPYRCIDANKNKKVDFFQYIYDRITVKPQTANGTIEYKNCFQNSPSGVSSDYWCGTGTPDDGNWVLISYNENSHNGVHYHVSNQWAREIVEVDCGVVTPIDWVLVEDNCATTGKKKWAKKVITYGCEFTNESIDENGAYSSTMSCKILGYDTTTATIDNGLHLEDVLTVLLNNICDNQLTVVSDFFQINPQNPSVTNYVTGLISQVNHLILFQKTDVKRPTTTGNANKAIWTFEKLIETLNFMFNVSYAIDGNTFRLEHISWFSRNNGINLNSSIYSKYVNGKKKYTYDVDNIPQREVFKFKEQFENATIDYSNDCAIGGNRDSEKSYIVDELTTNVQLCLNNPDKDSNVVEDSGFVLIATQKVGNDYYIITDASLQPQAINNTLASKNLVKNYHFHNRYLKTGLLNDEPVTFVTTRPLKKGETISIPLCCETVFNPNDAIPSPLGIGIVEKATFSLSTEMLDIDLKYNVFDNLQNNIAPVFTGNTSLKTYQETPVVFPLVINDADGTIASVGIVYQAYNGVVEILSNTQARYTPNAGFNGYDYFHLKAFDNWGEASNNAGFAVHVLPPNQPPIAVNDLYNVYQGQPFTAYLGIFNNDSDDNGFTLLSTSVVTAQGVAISINPTNGVFSYTPPTTFEGDDTFQYTIQDDTGAQSTATVTLRVGFINKPVGVNDNYSTQKNTALTIDGVSAGQLKLVSNDYTPDGTGGALYCTAETKATAQGGTVTINSNGTFTYTPPTNFTGLDNFTYTVNNTNGAATGNAYISVLPTIYVKLVQSNQVRHKKPKQNCNGGLVPAGSYLTRDYTLYFYSDAAGTIPFDVTGLGLVVNYRDAYYIHGDFGTSNYNDDAQTSTLTGVSQVLYNDFVYYDRDIYCEGLEYITEITTTLLSGGYQII